MARSSATTNVLNNGYIYIVGGFANHINKSVNIIDIFDSNKNQIINQKYNTKYCITEHTSLVLDENRILIIGGQYYDQNKNKWISSPNQLSDTVVKNTLDPSTKHEL